MIPYIEEHVKKGGKPNQIIRHILGLFNGVRGAKYFRRYLSENMYTMTDIQSLLNGSVLQITDI
jgi:tRNA-dihydrouridine synthase A